MRETPLSTIERNFITQAVKQNLVSGQTKAANTR